MAEQVDGDHVGARGGQVAGQRLVHPARHQLPVERARPSGRRRRTRCTPAGGRRGRTGRSAPKPGSWAPPWHVGVPQVAQSASRAGSKAAPKHAVWARISEWTGHGCARRPAGRALLVLAAYVAGRRRARRRASHRQHRRLVAGRRTRRARRAPGAAAAVAGRVRRADARVRAREPHRRAGRVAVSVLLGSADVAETVVVGRLVARYVGRRMRDVQDVWRLFAIAALGALVAARGVLDLRPPPLDADSGRRSGLIVPSHAASVMLLAPVALLSCRAPRAAPVAACRARRPGACS